ncbi:MAG: YebC/PmpR family DNA-binding transcriptional regulator [Rhizobacter sp.]|nr:YebC/PmpR family DNA-binding transcriptional regulator [Chlorobiales bacterium]
MGRIFEKRKYKMFARWAKMSKAFTKLGREIALAVKGSGPDPAGNPRLRLVIQNAKSVNMPKDRIDAAIKRASSKEEGDFQELTYEGYGPHGVPLFIETATDNPTRTVANLRTILSRNGGSLGAEGSVGFMFERKGIFKISPEGRNVEELELELIDHGADDFVVDDEGEVFVYTAFSDYGAMQKALEEKKIPVLNAALQRLPTTATELSEEAELEVMTLIDKLEEDDDVQAVYHNMK